ncbi:MAG: NADH-quinone oxidoreductase subunit C, partial [Prevotellaceae bacterium]|nr:NADH-quinone oxidoreductase subunit C [Prevotellaceae bacterium]
MEKIIELIQKTASSAVIEENKILTITVEPKEAHVLFATLYNNENLPFDFLKYLIGKDLGENLEVEYLVSSSKNSAVE